MKFNFKQVDLKSIILGLKKGYNVPTLPTKLDLIYNNIYIRILRFIGGLCLLFVLSNLYLTLPTYLHRITIIIGSIQIIQILIIFLIKIVYGIYTLKYKSKDFEVRNSPLNKYATYIAKALYCAKVGCAVTGASAGVIAAGISFDTVLEQAGRDKVFVPFLGSLYVDIFGELPKNTTNPIERLNLESPVSVVDKSDLQVAIDSYRKLPRDKQLVFLNELDTDVDIKRVKSN